MRKQTVLILCTGNSCRSQMAEGILRHYGNHRFEVFSAGTSPALVNPIAIQVMQEIGIDISRHASKHTSLFRDKKIDYVITVCDNAKESCPVFHGAGKTLHWPFPDPPHASAPTPAVIEEFRKVRDLIHQKFKAAAERGFGES